MVQVLLIILKVLGITLLILLGIVILLVLLAMIAPFCYTLDAEYYGDIKAVGRIRWLCFVLDFKGMYGNSRFLYYLKSFGFTISTNDETDKHFRSSDSRTEETGPEEPDTVPITVVKDDYEEFLKEQEAADVTEPEFPPKIQRGQEKEELQQEPEREALPEPVETQRGFFLRIHDKGKEAVEWVTTIPMRIHDKISEILARILDFFANIKENVNRLIEKKNEIVEKITEIRDFLQKPSTRQVWKDGKRYLIKLWKHIRPRRFHGTLHFGLEDPAATGQALGAVSMLFPWYRDHIIIAPDFEQRIFEGQIYAKGRIQIGFFLILGLQMLWNRNLIKTVQEAKTIIGGNK